MPSATPGDSHAQWLKELKHLEPRLQNLLASIFEAIVEVAASLTTAQSHEVGSVNSFGDSQIQADVQADNIIFKHLKLSGSVSTASSEEQSDMIPLGGEGYSVAFDPLDGSSIVAANFAVGSIFGVWPSATLLGQKGEEQVVAMYSIYGPKTIVVLACSRPDPAAGKMVQEYKLSADGRWELSKSDIRVSERAVFAPANLRSAAENSAYQKLMTEWIAAQYTLRYSGSMVADVHHMVAKGGGVFCAPGSASAPAKLRLLYECAPLAFVLEAAGGASHDGFASILSRTIEGSGCRTPISLGSTRLVDMCVDALKSSGGSHCGGMGGWGRGGRGVKMPWCRVNYQCDRHDLQARALENVPGLPA